MKTKTFKTEMEMAMINSAQMETAMVKTAQRKTVMAKTAQRKTVIVKTAQMEIAMVKTAQMEITMVKTAQMEIAMVKTAQTEIAMVKTAQMGILVVKTETTIRKIKTAQTKMEIQTIKTAQTESCSEIQKEDDSSASGIYTLILDGKQKEVYCEMKNGDGWTVLQRRGEFENEENYFYRNWEEYRDGFGELEGEHWIGLEAMFELTNQKKKVDLRFILEDYEGNRTAVTLVEFRVANEESGYRLFYKGIINHSRSKYPCWAGACLPRAQSSLP
ncbi:Techylectin-5B [Caligus rogercresseyi]|uniref:Techylectin-5B n=1 Tax=Caligus rogercresseyi TaxID=217165 RepID=A0A7T8GWN5_CALRO|nr:Techylectin-5B [Caligus rogercresseyi]